MEICRYSDFFDVQFASGLSECRLFPPVIHRKRWEYGYILRCSQQQQRMHSEWPAHGKKLHAIGFGVGREPITAALVNRNYKVTATDYWSEEWGEFNQCASSLEQANRPWVSDESLRENAQFLSINMNDVRKAVEDGVLTPGSYDFIWSACALEHLGSLSHGIQFILNTLPLLRPGGVAAHTTEFNVTSDEETLESEGLSLYRQKDLDRLVEMVEDAGYEICGDKKVDVEPRHKYEKLVAEIKSPVHLRYKVEQFVTTSLGICIRRPHDKTQI